MGRGLRRLGRHEEARQTLVDAVTDLSDPPDATTVEALAELSVLEAFGSDMDRPLARIAEAFRLAQSLALPLHHYTNLFTSSGIVHTASNCHVESIVAFREAARLAELFGDTDRHGMAQLNLSDSLLSQGQWDAAVEAGQIGMAILRRTGSATWAFAAGNLMQALLYAGRWDEVVEIGRVAEADGGIDEPYFAWCLALLHAFRGDVDDLPALMTLVSQMSESEDPQDRGTALSLDAIAAACTGDLVQAGDYARQSLNLGVGSSTEGVRWCWPIAADAALAAADDAEVERLLAWADDLPVGDLHPVVRAERERVRARMLAAREDPAAAEAFDNAVVALRELESPHYLAIGLMDQAEYVAADDSERASALLAEAQQIADRLGARPLLARVRTIAARTVQPAIH
jgi:hypothetical protein